MEKEFCAHPKMLTLVLTMWSLCCESCAIFICELNKLFMYKYMPCGLAICFSAVVQWFKRLNCFCLTLSKN